MVDNRRSSRVARREHRRRSSAHQRIARDVARRSRPLRIEGLEVRSLLSVDLVSALDATLATTISGNAASQAPAYNSDGRYLAFDSMAGDLVAGDTNAASDIFLRDGASGLLTRVSTDSAGNEANGDSFAPQLSADGRYLAFQSVASNLVAGDTNGVSDIFLKDLTTGAVTRVSNDSAGGQLIGASTRASLSADGRMVAFVTSVVSSTVVVKNLTTGVLVSVNTSSSGVVGNASSFDPCISGDGRYVAFASAANNLVSGDTNFMVDVFRKDLTTGDTTRVSTNSSGTQATGGDSVKPWLSSDGQIVAFQSYSNVLVAADTNGRGDVFVKNLLTGVATRASVDAGGNQTNYGDSFAPSLSGDGRYVAFLSQAGNLVSGDANFATDAFVKDLTTGLVVRASVDAAGNAADAATDGVSISSDGLHAALVTAASNLVAGVTTVVNNVFDKNLATGAVSLASTRNAGVVHHGGNADSEAAAISADGRYVAFQSKASNLIPGDSNAVDDVFLRDLTTGAITRVSADSDGSQTVGPSYAPSISADGSYVAFMSWAGNLPGGGLGGVFRKDAATGELAVVSCNSDGELANAASMYPQISANGQYVVFESLASNLVPDDANGASDIFVKDLATGAVTRVNTDADGRESTGPASDPSISADGAYVAFVSAAADLLAGDTNGGADVFVKNLATGAIVRASVDSLGNQFDGAAQNPSLSGDGQVVVFQTNSGTLVAGDTTEKIVAKDLIAGTLTLVSANSAGTPAAGNSYGAQVSADGRYAAFHSAAGNLVSNDADNWSDVFVKYIDLGAVFQISAGSSGSQANRDSSAAAFSADGRYVAFQSNATNLVGDDQSPVLDVYRFSVPQPPSAVALSNSNITEGLPPDGAAGITVGALSTVDPNANVTFAYSLVSGEGGDDNASFTIVGNELRTVGAMNYEPQGPLRRVRVRSTNSLGLWRDQQFTINVADVAPTVPVDSDAAANTVVEGAATGSAVGITALSTDPADGPLIYSITADSSGGGLQVDAATGVVTVADPSKVNYETSAGSISLTIAVSDGALGKTASFSLAVTNTAPPAPVDADAAASSVAEKAPAGTPVGLTVFADDPGGGPLQYSITADSSSGGFQIDALTGVVTVAAPNLVDFESSGGDHTLTVQATDGLQTSSATFTIIVTDVNEAPKNLTLTPGVVFASSQAGWVAGDLAATDEDAGDSLTYSLLDSAGGQFALSGSQIVAAAGAHFDPHVASTLNIRVRVADAGGLAYDADLAIAVREKYDSIALYDPASSLFYMRHTNTEGPADAIFGFGAAGAGWKPVAGDWNGDGADTIGLFDPIASTFYLRNSNDVGAADYTFGYGDPALAASGRYRLMMGDWDGDGVETVGLYDRQTAQWYLRNSNTVGVADVSFGYGEAGSTWTPIVGDWNGDGLDTIGFYDTQNAIYYLRNTNTIGFADYTFGYGQPGSTWTPIMGDWDGDADATIGFYDQASSHWYLRNSNDQGIADVHFGFGAAGQGWLPVVGTWSGSGAQALMAVGSGEQSGVSSPALIPNPQSLIPLVFTAIARWSAAGVLIAAPQVVLTDLPGATLGLAEGNTLYLDVDAAGHGWFIDPTPAANEEFSQPDRNGQMVAIDARAVDQIDLRTVIEHELDHLAGLDDLTSADSLMSGRLPTGVRRSAG